MITEIQNFDPLSASRPSQARGRHRVLLHSVSPAQDSLRCYFTMTTLHAEGNFQSLQNALPVLKELGINALWLSPVHPQTMRNEHYYWPSDHSKVDEAIGGDKAYCKLVHEARKRGIEICQDCVLNHFGYYAQHELAQGGNIRPDTTEAGTKTLQELFQRLDASGNREEVLEIQQEIAQISLQGLPSLQHDKKEVQEYLIGSYKKFVDMGVRFFRLDAAKHVSLAFLKQFISALQTHGTRCGKRVRFVLELLLGNYFAFEVFAGEILNAVPDPEQVFFFDFPQAFELRKVTECDYQFDWFARWLHYREANTHQARHYMPMLENHDFETRFTNTFEAKAAHVMSEFVSWNSVVLFHGAETTGRMQEPREYLPTINPQGDLGLLLKTVAHALHDYRSSQRFGCTTIQRADEDGLILEKSLEHKSIFVLINKKYTYEIHGQLVWAEEHVRRTQLRVVYQENGAALWADGNRFPYRLPPRSMVFVELLH